MNHWLCLQEDVCRLEKKLAEDSSVHYLSYYGVETVLRSLNVMECVVHQQQSGYDFAAVNFVLTLV